MALDIRTISMDDPRPLHQPPGPPHIDLVISLGEPDSSTSQSSRSSSSRFKIVPVDLLISLVTPPLLLGILSSHAAALALHQLGQVSEELFRGDRLPVLGRLDITETD